MNDRSSSPPLVARLLVADDHVLFRDALVAYINRAEPDFTIISAVDLQQAHNQLLTGDLFDLVLVDWHMPGVSSLADIKALMTSYPQTRFALMSGVIEAVDAEEALAAGIVGYFPKTLSGRALIEGVRQLLRGERFVPTLPGVSTLPPAYQGGKLAVNKGASAATKALFDQLTARERQVLAHLVQGATNAEIAQEMGIKDVTVKLHLRNAFEKIGARNRTDAALKCREAGLLDHAQ